MKKTLLTVACAFALGLSANASADKVELKGFYPLSEHDSAINGYEFAKKNAINNLSEKLADRGDMFSINMTRKQRIFLLSVSPTVNKSNITQHLYKPCAESQFGCVYVNVEVWYDPNVIKQQISAKAMSESLKGKIKRLIEKESLKLGSGNANSLSEQENARIYQNLITLIEAQEISGGHSFDVGTEYKNNAPTADEKRQKARDNLLKQYDEASKAGVLFQALQKKLSLEQTKGLQKIQVTALNAAKPNYRIEGLSVAHISDDFLFLKIRTAKRSVYFDWNDAFFNLIEKTTGIKVHELYEEKLNSYSSKVDISGGFEGHEDPWFNSINRPRYVIHGYKAGQNLNSYKLPLVDQWDVRVTPVTGIVLVQDFYYGSQTQPFHTQPLNGDIVGYLQKDGLNHNYKGVTSRTFGRMFEELANYNNEYYLRVTKPKGFNESDIKSITVKQRVVTFNPPEFDSYRNRWIK